MYFIRCKRHNVAMPKLAVLGRPVRVLRVSPNYKTNRAVMMCDYRHAR